MYIFLDKRIVLSLGASTGIGCIEEAKKAVHMEFRRRWAALWTALGVLTSSMSA